MQVLSAGVFSSASPRWDSPSELLLKAGVFLLAVEGDVGGGVGKGRPSEVGACLWTLNNFL